MVHLLTGHKYIEWELADSSNRDQTIEELVTFIRERVLPYFHKFTDPKAVVSRLCSDDIPEFALGSEVEFALWQGARDTAQRLLTRFWATRPDLRSAIV
jgi:hypothetical protein